MGSDTSITNIHEKILEHYKNYKNNELKYHIDCSIHQNKGMNEYIYNLDVEIKESIPPEFIFIVDRSGSMHSYFEFIITKTIPEVLEALGYKDRKIHLITFASGIGYFSLSNSELLKSNLCSGGGTSMSRSFDALGKILEISKEICNHLRIVVITDGILDDQSETKERGELLYQTYKDMFKINSQCIRLNTGSTPETEGIMSILKLNNVKLCHLVEHNSNDMDNLAKVIIKLFLDDGLVGTPLKIGGENVKLKNNPWEESNSNTQPLRNGRSTFFSDSDKPLYVVNEKSNSDKELKKGKEPIKCKKGAEVNSDNYESIVGEEKINNIFQKLRMNKILNSKESRNENVLITNYFKNLTVKIKKVDDNDNSLDYLNEEINEINNDNSIYYLDQNKKANYVENLPNIKRNLQIKILQKENKKMKEQINEIVNKNEVLHKELDMIKNKMENLEKKFELMVENNKENKNKIAINENNHISLKKEVDEIKSKLSEEEPKEKEDVIKSIDTSIDSAEKINEVNESNKNSEENKDLNEKKLETEIKSVNEPREDVEEVKKIESIKENDNKTDCDSNNKTDKSSDDEVILK